jgi:MoxR-like ATPase
VRIDHNFYGNPFFRNDLKQHPVLKDLGPIKFPNATNYKVSPEQWASYRKLWFAIKEKVPTPMKDLDQLAADLYLEPTTALQEIVDLLKDRKQAIFYGPPGTGKTRVALDLAEAFAGTEDRVELVQFHPSYAYEDFVEGWRPTEDGNFKLKPGPLRRLAKRAEEEESHNFVLVIDEINRANLSKVLGELFFLFEYRDHQVTLQYSEERFSLPKNLYILGTMNTADRSIALVDAALRRRFHFHQFFPDRPPVEGTLNRYLNKHNPSLRWLTDVVDRANEKLADPNIAIGHSHFFRPDLSEELIGKIWKHSILPYVEDQFFDDPDRVAQFTIDALRSDDTTNPEEDDADDPTN